MGVAEGFGWGFDADVVEQQRVRRGIRFALGEDDAAEKSGIEGIERGAAEARERYADAGPVTRPQAGGEGAERLLRGMAVLRVGESDPRQMRRGEGLGAPEPRGRAYRPPSRSRDCASGTGQGVRSSRPAGGSAR